MMKNKILKAFCSMTLLWAAILLPAFVSFWQTIGIVIALAGLEGAVFLGKRKSGNWVIVTYIASILALVFIKTYELTLLGAVILGGILSLFLVISYIIKLIFRKRIRNKIVLNIIPLVALICSGCVSFILFQHEYAKYNTTTFNPDVIMFLEGKEVAFGEFLLYATNVYQNYNAAYGTNIWSQLVTDEEGNEFTFEEQTKQVIIEQIRLTKLLYIKKDEYLISLSQDELKLLKADANEYFKGLASSGITADIVSEKNVEAFYIENAISQKVYNKIIENIDVSKMSEEEAENARIDAFTVEYDMITRELNPNWDYKKDVNMEALIQISFAELAGSNPLSTQETTTNYSN
ncbi:hypothetical protein acsn021_06360 [Anaerocolumna cellulosilytica]|uniref:Uncharacterized protein n=1 Tax=Anaerocolumna cellulosilytica TaxID=433286 RepID=A0A6S6QYW6_9FIRM|nr:hypothetical protein [Anaerocolumna cellulosilytica]MBB5198090.1 uncharacterized SAM-binding protein YcdF (DUF218 family) [Anaerocolumna cellulosilytica]BCJ93067.1 hypothetical protein acsn021_06360 [Anaerocolumna cellulosilytica]